MRPQKHSAPQLGKGAARTSSNHLPPGWGGGLPLSDAPKPEMFSEASFFFWPLLATAKGGRDLARAKFAMAKLNADKIWHPFLNTTEKFGPNSQIVAQQPKIVNGGCFFYGPVVGCSHFLEASGCLLAYRHTAAAPTSLLKGPCRVQRLYRKPTLAGTQYYGKLSTLALQACFLPPPPLIRTGWEGPPPRVAMDRQPKRNHNAFCGGRHCCMHQPKRTIRAHHMHNWSCNLLNPLLQNKNQGKNNRYNGRSSFK